MTHLHHDETGKKLLVIAEEAPGTCELCHRPGQELRPYGPKGENICIDCGMANPITTSAALNRLADQADEYAVSGRQAIAAAAEMLGPGHMRIV